MQIKWYVVAPDGRLDKFSRQVVRPTFRELAKPLHTVCGFIPYAKLLEALRSAEEFLEDLKPTFLDKLAQRYDPKEAFEE